MNVSQVIRDFIAKPALKDFTGITLLGFVYPVTVVHMEPSAYSATVLGHASAKWVSLALLVINAKMDIMVSMRMVACPVSAIIDQLVVMSSQVSV